MPKGLLSFLFYVTSVEEFRREMWQDLERSLNRFDVRPQARPACGAMTHAAIAFRRDGSTIAQQMAAESSLWSFSWELFDHVAEELEQLGEKGGRPHVPVPAWLTNQADAEEALLLDYVFTHVYSDPAQIAEAALTPMLEARYIADGYHVDEAEVRTTLNQLAQPNPTIPSGFKAALVRDYARPGWMRAW